MSHYFNFRSFDIAHLTNQFKDKNIEEIFPNHGIRHNDIGNFMEITWKVNLTTKIKLSSARRFILNNLKTVYFIGKNIERTLNREGVKNLYDLKYNLKYSNSVIYYLH